jgi:hypothetical protein
MKTITIHLPDVEAAMLLDLMKASKKTGSIASFIVDLIRDSHLRLRKNGNR